MTRSSMASSSALRRCSVAAASASFAPGCASAGGPCRRSALATDGGPHAPHAETSAAWLACPAGPAATGGGCSINGCQTTALLWAASSACSACGRRARMRCR